MKELFFQVFVAMTACAQNEDMGGNYQAVDKSMESVLSSEFVSTELYTKPRLMYQDMIWTKLNTIQAIRTRS